MIHSVIQVDQFVSIVVEASCLVTRPLRSLLARLHRHFVRKGARPASHPDGAAKGRKTFAGWYAEFYDASRVPKQKRVSLQTKDESVARTALAQLDEAYRAGRYDPWTQPAPSSSVGAALSLADAVARFIESRELAGLSSAGVARYRAVLDPFVASCPALIGLGHVRPEHVEAFVTAPHVRTRKDGTRTEKPRSEATVKDYRARIGIFATWCRAEGYAPESWQPVVAVRARGKAARVERTVRYFTEDELASLVTTIETAATDDMARRHPMRGEAARRLLPVVLFTASTGLRREEVCALRWGAVHASEGFVTVANTEGDEAGQAFTTKSGRERTIPLVGDAAAVVAQLRAEYIARTGEPPAPSAFVFTGQRGGRLYGPYLSKAFRAFVRAAKLREGDAHNFHSLRHTFGTLAVSRGVDVYRVKEAMGHARIETTLTYARLRPVSLQSEMQRAFGGGIVTRAVQSNGAAKAEQAAEAADASG